MKQPKGFIILASRRKNIQKLTVEGKARLLDALCAHFDGEDIDLSDVPAAEMLADIMYDDMDFAKEKYTETYENRSQAGKKGGESSKQTEANASKPKQTEANASKPKQTEANASKPKQTEANASKTIETNTETDTDTEYNNSPNGECARPDDFVRQYNEICQSLPKVKALNDSRKRKVKELIKLLKAQSFGISEYLKVIEGSDFLTGREGKWSASFDWIITKSNAIKIIEGNYRNKDRPPNKKGVSVFSTEGASFNLAEYEKRSIFDD